MAKLPMGPPSLPSEPPNSDDTMNIVGLQTSTKLFSVDPPQFPKVPIDTPPTVSLNIPLSNLSDSSAPVAQSGQIMDAVDECEGGVREEPGTTSGHDEKTNPASMENKAKAFAAPYTIPLWSEHSGHPFYVEVLKDGTIIEQLDVSKKGAYMFGRVDLCDFILEHPTISRYHAVLQFKKNGETFLYDLGSTHGTSINKSQVKKKVYTDLHVGDVIRFGQSSRLYIFQGPSEFMPPEGDLGKLRKYKIHEEVKDREASLSRARAEASLADGISWGMAEDAPEEDAEDDAYEITWQTYHGQLTERQEKTRSKIIKRMEKVANMKKENDAIRAKDISQGGLTQGQQTQIARNEQRTSQIMEELESLEETLNESIQESIGARVKKVSSSKKKGIIDDEDEIASDDDDFYDRTKKVGSLKNSSDQQSVETADTLLEKKEAILREMEEKAILLQRENAKSISKTTDNIDQEDALDAYMTGLSSKLVFDASTKIQSEISTLQSELDRILYLLKIADPTGEAAQKKDAKPLISKSDEPSTLITNNIPKKSPSSSRKEKGNSKKPVATLPSQIVQAENPTEKGGDVTERENKAPAYFPTKPLLLGAVKDDESVDSIVDKPIVEEQEPDHFIDYKDRKKALCPTNGNDKIEDAAPGLILRKRKHTDEPRAHGSSGQESTLTSAESETAAAEAVALLLKHKRGYFGDDDEGDNIEQSQGGSPTGKKSQPKRVLGPEIPAFLKNSKDFESWVPPKGQSGDGRTALNDKFGY